MKIKVVTPEGKIQEVDLVTGARIHVSMTYTYIDVHYNAAKNIVHAFDKEGFYQGIINLHSTPKQPPRDYIYRNGNIKEA